MRSDYVSEPLKNIDRELKREFEQVSRDLTVKGMTLELMKKLVHIMEQTGTVRIKNNEDQSQQEECHENPESHSKS